jgi:hypothetical protein
MPDSTPTTRAEAKAAAAPDRWIPSRAVRLWLYGIAAATAAVLIGYGILTIEQGGLWLVLVSAVLGVGNLLAAGNVPK